MHRCCVALCDGVVAVFLCFSLLLLAPPASTFNLSDCNLALGMETGGLADAQITSSSSYDAMSVGPQNARIRTDHAGGAWCPGKPVGPDSYEWIQIDLRIPHLITAIETQGRHGNGVGVEYSPAYVIEYWRPGLQHWARYADKESKEILPANADPSNVVHRSLDSPVVASKIRLVPWAQHSRTVCLRLELYGCAFSSPLLAYNSPEGIKQLGGIDLSDRSFDGFDSEGEEEAGKGRNFGLGQLHDGVVGRDNFRQNPFEWIGWNQDTLDGAPVEFTFEFNGVRNFSTVSIHCNNQFRRGVQVFQTAKLYFSLDGKNYIDQNAVVFEYEADLIIDKSRWVLIPIRNRVGKFMKVELFFASKLLMISEIQFDSVAVRHNVTVLPRVTDDIPVLFSTIGGDGIESGSIAVFTLDQMPAEYIGLIVGVSLTVAALCAAVILIVIWKHKSKLPTPYSSVYTGLRLGTPATMKSLAEPKEVQIVLTADGQVFSRAAPSFNNICLLDEPIPPTLTKLPSSSPPKRIPSGLSSPDYHGSQLSEWSEYAEPDCPPQPKAPPPHLEEIIPLIPPPPSFQKRGTLCRNASQNNHHNNLNLQLSESQHSLQGSKCAFNGQPSCSKHYQLQGVSGTVAYGCYGDQAALLSPARDVPQIHRNKLKFLEKLGEGEFGEVHLCELESSPQTDVYCRNRNNLVAVKLLRKAASQGARNDFEKELAVISKLNCEEIVRLLGVCSEDEPWCMVTEYMTRGDLNQYLQKHRAELNFEHLTQMAVQIAQGMCYLEQRNFVHRDLATRNCLVGDNLQIKIADFGMARSLYSSDYYRIEGHFVLPIRWMAWESILLGKFTPKTDVWSMGVLLWEMVTFACQQPFAQLSDQQVIENVQHICHTGAPQVCLPQPAECPDELYELQLQCWHRDDALRPSFTQIRAFLAQLHSDLHPSRQIVV